MSEIGQRITDLSPEQRALLMKHLAGNAARSAPRVGAAAREPIAIVGAACRLPGGANDLNEFWRLLRDGVDAITPVPRERWDADRLYDQDPDAAGKVASRWGGFIKDVDQFDAAYFGISPREAAEMDPQQRIVLETAFDALDNAGMVREALAGEAMGVFVGVHGHASDYLLLQNENLAEIDAFSGTGAAHNLLAGRLSYVLDTSGPAVVVDTACSSSLVALKRTGRRRQSDPDAKLHRCRVADAHDGSRWPLQGVRPARQRLCAQRGLRRRRAASIV
jgi:hypothetical protein